MSTIDIAVTAPNQIVDAANGVRYAYRRFGAASTDTLPLIMLVHFRGNLDNWDPLLLSALGSGREVITVDNAGVGLSTGLVPPTFTQMARDALSFVDALGLTRIDLLGFSIGGMIAQELTLIRPQLVRRLVLAGTAPRSGHLIHGWINDVQYLANVADNHPEDLLSLFFDVTATSQQAGREFLERRAARREDLDKPASLQARDAQMDAMTEWGIPDPTMLNRLAGITQPVLVANGDNDIMIPTPNSWLLAQHLPNARVRLYPDSGHGFLFQWAEQFAALVHSFLSGAGETKAP
ncbi:alpha/beta fold hydrolase [Streptomyces sp. NPDC090080]|uniref:alpha/beta fold hydrolase n=1 Tax=Streptomyces sp. NPDC090080 TaxID=3365939 RepID=UPI00382D3C81